MLNIHNQHYSFKNHDVIKIVHKLYFVSTLIMKIIYPTIVLSCDIMGSSQNWPNFSFVEPEVDCSTNIFYLAEYHRKW